MDAYEIRREAERLIGEDRVPTDVLQEIIEQYGDQPRYYEPPEFVTGTVFDPTDDTFGPIMAAIQKGNFEEAVRLLNVLTLTCPECGEKVWDGPVGSKLAKCWNGEGHASGAPLAFDTME